MKYFATLFLIFGMISSTTAQEELEFTGKVVDKNGAVVAGAEVGAWSVAYESGTQVLTLTGKMFVKEDGAFSFKTTAPANTEYVTYMVAARREGLALGFQNFHYSRSQNYLDKAKDIVLGDASHISGVVVDAAGKPIAGARLKSIIMLNDINGSNRLIASAPFDWLPTTTDANGCFRLEGIPSLSRACFNVNAAGMGVYSENTVMQRGKWEAGQEDVRLEMVAEGRIKGSVVDVDGKKLAGVPIQVFAKGTFKYYSSEDGTFDIGELPAAPVTLFLAAPDDPKAKYRVAKAIKINNLQPGQVVNDIELKVVANAGLEIKVMDSNNKPASNAKAYVHWKDGDQMISLVTNEDGVASVRAGVGEYTLNQVVYPDHQYKRPGDLPKMILSDGQVHKEEVTLQRLPYASGIVLDTEGKPVAGARMQAAVGGNGTVTGADGKFDFRWQYWNEEDETSLIVQQEERNLVSIFPVDGENNKDLTIRLAPGNIVSGSVVDAQGKPIAGATVTPSATIGRYGISLQSQTVDAQGRFTLKALPPDNHINVTAHAKGFGRRYQNAGPEQIRDGRVDLPPIVLDVADQTVSGVIVDSAGNPLPGVQVSVHGEKQPYVVSTSDKSGKFILKGVVAAQVQLNAWTNQDGMHLDGFRTIPLPTNDVELVLGQNENGNRNYDSKRLAGKALPPLKNCGLQIADEAVKGKKILVCFWNHQQRPSRHALDALGSTLQNSKDANMQLLLVHLGSVAADKLQAQLATAKLTCPNSVVEDKDSQQLSLNWGARSLPWFVLSDERQIVIAEGFELDMLKELLEKKAEKGQVQAAQ